MSIGKWTWTVGVVMAMLLAPEAAFAQSVGGDEVALKNGGILRGTFVTMEPGQDVVISIPGTSAPRRVAWAEIARVTRGDGAVVAMPPVPLPGLPPPMPSELGAPRIHIESDSLVTLHEATVSDDGRVRPIVCATPCDAVVDGRNGSVFYFAGDEIPQSSRFHLTEKSGDVTARVSPGNRSLGVAGNVFVTLGVLGASSGAVMLPLGVALNASKSSTPASPGAPVDTSTSPLPVVGGVMLGVGAAVLTAGIVMKVLGATRYDFTPGARSAHAYLDGGVLRF